jgi:hypothetical protein
MDVRQNDLSLFSEKDLSEKKKLNFIGLMTHHYVNLFIDLQPYQCRMAIKSILRKPSCQHRLVGAREKAMDAGFSGYIAKPIDPYTFALQVEKT